MEKSSTIHSEEKVREKKEASNEERERMPHARTPNCAPYPVHAFEFTRKHGISVEDEIRYFTTVLKVLEHTKGELEYSTRKGAYQLTIAHIDHPMMVKFMSSNPKYMDVLTAFIEKATRNLETEFQKIENKAGDKKNEGDGVKLLEEECGLIMAAYGNFIGSCVKITNDCLASLMGLFPIVNRWRSFWNASQFNSIKSLPFGLWANMTRDPSRCFILCSLYEKEMQGLIDSIGQYRYHSDLRSLAYMLNNMAMTQIGRRILTKNPENLEVLASYINMDPSECDPEIRKYLVGTFLHIAKEPENHGTILDPNTDVFGMILRPITGCGKLSDDELMELPNIVCSNYMTNKELTPDENIQTRHALLQFLWHLSSTQPSRVFMRSKGVYYLLRELDTWETERINSSPKDTYESYSSCLEGIIQVMIHTEDELLESGEAESLTRMHPDPPIGDVSRFVKPSKSPRLDAAIESLVKKANAS